MNRLKSKKVRKNGGACEVREDVRPGVNPLTAGGFLFFHPFKTLYMTYKIELQLTTK